MTLRTLSLFAAVLLTLRVLLLLADLDPIEERVMEVFEYSPTPWTEGPARTLYDREELYTATAAEAIRQNLGIPISMYQFMEYGGGSLLVTLLAVPILGVLGPYYLAFKSIALAVTLLCGVTWTWLAFAWFGRRVGSAMALLFIFAPSVFVRTMLIAKGDHSEAAAWIGLTLVFASLAARGVLGRLPGEGDDGGSTVSSREGDTSSGDEDDGRVSVSSREGSDGRLSVSSREGNDRRVSVSSREGNDRVSSVSSRDRVAARWAVMAGITFGFGVFITYSTVPVLAATLAIALLATRMRPRRIWMAGFVGLGAGLLPWIWNLIQSEGRALRIYESTLGKGEGLAAARERIVGLISTGFFASYDLPAARNLAGFAFGAAVVAGWVLLVRLVLASNGSKAKLQDPRSAAAVIVVSGALAHLAAFCISAPDASSRYIIPAYPLLLLAVASIGAFGKSRAPASDRRDMRRSWILPGLLVLIAAVAQIGTFVTGSYRSLATPLRATDWRLLGEIVGQKLAAESFAHLPEPMQSHFWVGFGKRVFGFVDRALWEEAIAIAPPNERAAVWEGIGTGWVESGLVLDAGSFVDSLAEVDRIAIVRGMESYGEIVFAPMIVAGEDLARVRSRMAGSSGSRLAASQARVAGILEWNGARVPVTKGLFPEEKAAGLGWAQYGGIGRKGLVVRKPSGAVPPSSAVPLPGAGSPPGAVLPRGAGSPPAGPPASAGPASSAASPSSRGGNWAHPASSMAQWSGFVAAFSRDLALVDPRWLLEPGNPDGPTHLRETLERSAQGLSQEMETALYAAAGRAAAAAWLDPSIDGDVRALRSTWPWRRSIPERHHPGFERGLVGSDEE